MFRPDSANSHVAVAGKSANLAPRVFTGASRRADSAATSLRSGRPARRLVCVAMSCWKAARRAGVSEHKRLGGIKKSARVHAGLSELGSVMPNVTSFVGRYISVPYSLIIDDDYSGLTCESRVLAQSARGCLVILAGEKLWRPASFIQQWLCDDLPEADADAAASSLQGSAYPTPRLHTLLRNREEAPGQATHATSMLAWPPSLAHGGGAREDDSSHDVPLTRGVPLTRSGVSDLLDESNLLGDEDGDGCALNNLRNLSCVSLASCEL